MVGEGGLPAEDDEEAGLARVRNAVELLGCARMTTQSVAVSECLRESVRELLPQAVPMWSRDARAGLLLAGAEDGLVWSLELDHVVVAIEALKQEIHRPARSGLLRSDARVLKPKKQRVCREELMHVGLASTPVLQQGAIVVQVARASATRSPTLSRSTTAAASRPG